MSPQPKHGQAIGNEARYPAVPKRIQPFRSLDVFRGLAALWIVMYHSCVPFLAEFPTYYSNPLYNVAIRGQLGVVLFFVISGYCITAAAYGALISGKPVSRYFYERFRRIYPPYFAAIVLIVFSTMLVFWAQAHHYIQPVHHWTPLSKSPRFWFANLFLVQFEFHIQTLNVVFWSLCYEVAFYVIIGVGLALAKRLAHHKGPQWGITFLIASLAGSTVLALVYMMVFHRAAMFPFDLWHQFAMGGVLFFLLETNPQTVIGYSVSLRNLVWGAALAVALCAALFAAIAHLGQGDIMHPSSSACALCCLLFCVFLAFLRRFADTHHDHPLVRPWMWLGAFSYSIYLAHSIVLGYIEMACRKLGMYGDKYWMSLFIQVILSVAFSRLLFLAVERRFISKRQVERLASEHVV